MHPFAAYLPEAYLLPKRELLARSVIAVQQAWQHYKAAITKEGKSPRSRLVGAVVWVLTEPFDVGAAPVTVKARRLVLIAEGLFPLANPEMEPGNFRIAYDTRPAFGEWFALNCGVGKQYPLGVRGRH
jgi:hypothetical protein